jgi:hypothetical protein
MLLACSPMPLPVARADTPVMTPPSPILPGRPDAPPPDASPSQSNVADHLATRFEDAAAGISFLPPPGLKQIRGVPGDVIVRYVDDDRHWVLTVSKLEFDRPVRLSNPAATQPQPVMQRTSKGILDITIEQIKHDAPGAEIFRDDVVSIAGMDVGMLAGRYSVGPQTNLTQQAIFQADDRNFYLFNLTVPAPRKGEMGDDPGVQEAVSQFTDMLDTVRVLEQTSVRQEQDERLMHTRTLFVNWTPDKIKAALVKEQWLRLIKDGKDVGYSYVIEQLGRDLPRPGQQDAEFTGGEDGALIGIRSRSDPSPGVRVVSESWMWVSFDRKHEKWANNTWIDRGKDANGKPQVEHTGNVGSADTEQRTVYDKNLVNTPDKFGPGAKDIDPNQPPFRMVEVNMLNAEQFGSNQNSEPFTQELPVFYLQQALAHLLPRLVPRREATRYMFASYVPEKRSVMARYVDVGVEQEAKIGGQTVMAIPVRDRIGLEGSVTTHYVSRTGQYLGSVNPDSNVEILPTDKPTLLSLWQSADLSPPQAVPLSPAK